MKLKSISLLLLLPTLMLFAGCSNSELTPAATPNLDVTVQARVAIALTAIPTATARVVVKEIPVEKIVKMVVTAAPLPTYTPALVEVVEVEKIVKVVVTATPTPMPTATATPTPTTTPTPSPTPLPGTVIGSASPGTMLYNDTTWTLSGSPYRIQGRLQVPENVTLTIEPGVTVIGEGGSITFYGVIKAEGTESSKVYFTGGGVSFVGKGGNESKLIIRHGELKDIDGLITNYLTFELYDSLLVDVSIGGGANTYLVPFTAERNTFINTGQIYFRSYATPTIRYNCFFGKPPMFTHNVFMGGSAQINYNSIYGVSPGTFRHTLRSGTGSIDATQNYWHGLAESDVRALIYDKTVDLGLGTSVDILPMLYEPHPDTPDCSRVNE